MRRGDAEGKRGYHATGRDVAQPNSDSESFATPIFFVCHIRLDREGSMLSSFPNYTRINFNILIFVSQVPHKRYIGGE